MSIDERLIGVWILDSSHSRIGFSTRHAMVTKVSGAFNEVSGQAKIAEEGFDQSQVNIVVQSASIDTRNNDRDQHLRSEEFFAVEQYPEIRFSSTSIDEVDSSSFIVNGDLTIRDITRNIAIPLELLGIDRDPMGNLRAGLEGARRIDRKDWGVRWNTPLDSGGVLISDRISLEFELSLIKET